MFEHLKAELRRLYAEPQVFGYNYNNCLNRILAIWEQLEDESDLPELDGYQARLLICAFMSHDNVDGFKKSLEKNILQRAIAIDVGSNGMVFQAAACANPLYFRIIFENSNNLLSYGTMRQKLINTAFHIDCEIACFETMQFLVDHTDVNSQGIYGAPLLSAVIQAPLISNHQLYEALKFLYESGVDFTKFHGQDLRKPERRNYFGFFSSVNPTPFEMLLDKGNVEAIQLMIDMDVVDIFKNGPNYLKFTEQKLQHAIEQGDFEKQNDFQQIINILSSHGMLRHKTPTPH